MSLHKWYTKKGFCQGPLDFAMRSDDDARELEALLKIAEEAGLKYQRLALVSDDGIDTKYKSARMTEEHEAQLKHTALVTATTNHLDRDAEVVMPRGLDLKMFRKNRVIQYAHNMDIPPIGQGVWERLENEKLKAFVKFADRPVDWQGEWFPDVIHALCQQGILKGVSIGFLPLEASAPTEKEIKATPALAGAKRIIRKSLLLEISIVNIGCNPEALVESVKGVCTPDFLKGYGFTFPEPEPEIDLKSLWAWDGSDCDNNPMKPVLSAADLKLAALKSLRSTLTKA